MNGTRETKKQTVFNEQKLFFLSLGISGSTIYIMPFVPLNKYCNGFFWHFKNDKYSNQSFLSDFTEYKSIFFGINWEFSWQSYGLLGYVKSYEIAICVLEYISDESYLCSRIHIWE